MARTKDFDENEVLSKAIDIFWVKGYNGTSMQDLVDGLGISRSSLYDTYTDKHTLYLKALESYQNSGCAKLKGIADRPGSARDTLNSLWELATDDLVDDKQQKGCLMVNAEVEVAPHDKEVNDMVCRNDQQVEEAFYQAIKRGQDSGEFKTLKDPRSLARFIFNAVKGLRVSAKSNLDQVTFDDITSLTLSILY